MTIITKTEPIHHEMTVFSGKTHYHYPNGSGWDQSWTDAFNTTYPAESISYERGPKYIRVDGHVKCNWKQCVHTGKVKPFPAVEGYQHNFKAANPVGGLSYESTMSNFRPAQWSDFTYPSPPPPEPIDLTDLANRMWTDLAGRCNEGLLTMEDLAGLISGKSLWSGIRGIAQAVSDMGRAVSKAKRLKRAFGAKASLYDCWTKSKELVRQIVGGHLAYRFSFKTTLNDICQGFELANQFQAAVNKLQMRNSSNYLMYSKDWQSSKEAKLVYASDDARRHLFYAGRNPKSLFMPPTGFDIPPVTCSTFTEQRARVYASAKVRYPAEYLTLKHYVQNWAGLDKPLTTIWAIVPLSFVVDYLLNVQDTLTYVDNKLNDYGIYVDIRDAWCLTSTSTRYQMAIPAAHFRWASPTYLGNDVQEIIWPEVNVSRREYQTFSRIPLVGDNLMAQLPPLISADEHNWLQRIGTGFELLSQTRLR